MNARIEKYLKGYSLLQAAGWCMAFLLLWYNREASFFTISVFQVLSLAEIFHAYKKWNNSSPVFCALQIIARLFILCWVYLLMLTSVFHPIQYLSAVVFLMLLAWCIAEILRYGYYLTQLFKREIRVLTWLRYSAFQLLYPVGVCCELYILFLVFRYHSLLWIKILIIITVIVYLIAFPRLYLHLRKQRKLKLSFNK